jgi:choline monooxygenase
VTATLPWSWYSDDELLRREQERIFARAWQYVGHTGRLAEGASFFASRAAHVPVVVTRARDGELRAFLNVCRHRGFAVADGAGERETLQCAYHAWTYGLDGSLRTAPRSEREPDFDPAELSLRPLRLETWGPFLFVNPQLDAAPLAEALGPVPALIAELLDVGELRFHHRVDWEVAANWKVVCENFLECYHCAVAHPSFSKLVDVSPDAYLLSSDGLTSSQHAPARDGGAGQFHFVWPNVGVNVFPGGANLSIGPMLPAGTGRTARWLDYFFAPDADEAWIAELLELDDRVGEEDRRLVEGVQRGVESGLLGEGRLMDANEPLVAHFQRLTREALH